MRKHHLLFLIVFLAQANCSIAIPIFPPLFLDSSSIVGSEVSYSLRTIILSMLLAIYPLGQLIGCPIIGKLSDWYGRRPLLLLTFLGLVPLNALAAFTISNNHLFLLFIARLFSGMLEGNVILAQASIADMTHHLELKNRRLAWLSSFRNGGFVAGPLLGAFFSNHKVVSWFNPATPFWFSALLSLAMCVVLLFFFEETRNVQRERRPRFHIHFLPLVQLFTLRSLRKVFVGNFLFYSAGFLFWGFFPFLLVKDFSFDSHQIALVISYLSFWFILTPPFYRIFSRRFSPKRAFMWISVWVGLLLIATILPSNPIYLIATLPPLAILIGVGDVYGSILISNTASPHLQGEAFGIDQSLAVVSEFVTLAVGGLFASVYLFFPFALAVILTWLAALYLRAQLKKSPGV